jgi:hypothetical protein
MRIALLAVALAALIGFSMRPSVHESSAAVPHMLGDAPFPIAAEAGPGCPGQYAEFLPPPHAQFFLRCWGHREPTAVTEGEAGVTIDLRGINALLHHGPCGRDPAPGGFCL